MASGDGSVFCAANLVILESHRTATPCATDLPVIIASLVASPLVGKPDSAMKLDRGGETLTMQLVVYYKVQWQSFPRRSKVPIYQKTRRAFLATTAGGFAAAGELTFLSQFPRVSAEEARLDPNVVRFDANIEPLVQLIEESPRDALLERVAERIRRGDSYREVLAALLLAGIRNVQPRPSVGFKFHCVLVVNSCHSASLAGPDEDRWLPIFWALDYFKSSQADEARQGGWRMSAVKESLVPNQMQAASWFTEAMDNWDIEKADSATAGLIRTRGATEVFNLFARYAARDF